MSSKPIHFSVTEAKIASLCPRKFVINKKYGKRVFRGKTSGIGNLIHLILAGFAQRATKSQRFRDQLKIANEQQLKHLFRNGIQKILLELTQKKDISRWQAEEIELVNKSLETITNDLLNRFTQLKRKNNPLQALKKLFIAVEWRFKHRFEIKDNLSAKKFEIAGRIDWLTSDTNNQSLTLWDFKTSPQENLERDIAQVAIYSIIIEEIFGVETAAALMYISGETIHEHRIEPEILRQFKPTVFETIFNMSIWMEDNDNIPYTLYMDACDECIVSKFCIEKFGTNPHLEQLGITIDESREVEEEKELYEKDLTVETEIKPEESLITNRISKFDLDLKKDMDIDLSTYITKQVRNAFLGTILKNKNNLEIHPRVLLRHAVTLGASGSGKTVLGKVLIEEILQQEYSAILIDPQGDLCSLILPEDDIGNELVKKVNTKIYTPNSTKGIKLTIDPLAPPADEVLDDQDTLLTYLDATATQLLDILGYNIAKTPPEKALLESILKYEWKNRNRIDLRILAEKILETTVIRSVQDDSEVEIDLLINKRKQKELSQRVMKLVIGTEGSFFSGGETIDFNELTNKKSQLSIINLTSVGTDQSKRQLVVSWILRLIYDWLLRNPQKEQDKIRFFLYIDEIADFMPPHPKNPPSKKMLMLLMRQARKYGCAILIATQSPASIDYKAIDNIGTIFVGRIPTQQSLNKVETFLEPYGIETQRMIKKVQTVNPGEFILIGGGYTKPELFKTRWLHTKHQTLSLDDIEQYYN